MYPAFDIFKKEPGSRFVWLGTANTFAEANAKVQGESDSQAEFIIVNEETGERTVIKPSGPHKPGLQAA